MGSEQSKQLVDGIVVVLLGRTGAGKSTLGNVLLGLDPDEGTAFATKAGFDSCTAETTFKTGHWLGNEECPTFTMVDTPSFSDCKSRDSKHWKKMVKVLKEDVGAVHVFLWVMRADARFEEIDREYFKLFSDVFGKEEFQKRLVMVWTQSVPNI